MGIGGGLTVVVGLVVDDVDLTISSKVDFRKSLRSMLKLAFTASWIMVDKMAFWLSVNGSITDNRIQMYACWTE